MTSRSRHLLAGFALCIPALLAYSNSFSAGLAADNRVIILQDPRIRELTLHNLVLILKHTYWWPVTESGLYRPLTTLTYLFNYAILGNRENPAGYHWINFLLHAGNILLVYALARRFLREFWPPVFIAALWAVHPILTESVTNVVGRADLLAAMATLSGFLMYLKSTETNGRERFAWLAGLAAVTTAGVFSKESAVAIVGVIALYELAALCERTQWDRKRLGDFVAGCYALSLAFFAMWFLRSAVVAIAPVKFPFLDNPIVAAGFWTGRLTAIKVMAKYLGLLVWPAQLSCDYSYPQIPLANGSWPDWIAWISVAAMAVVAAFSFRRNRVAFFAAGFAFVTFLPASNLVLPIGTIMAERLLYLPSVGFAICLVLAIRAAASRVRARALAPVLLCLIASGFAVRTWARNADWREDLTLWTAAAQTSPNSFKAHTALAELMHQQHFDMNRVLAEEERSVTLLAPVPDLLNDPGPFRRTGVYYLEKGDLVRVSAPDGNALPPPASVRAYERSIAVLVRAVSIVKAYDSKYLARVRELGGTNVNNDAYRILSEAYLRLGETEKALVAGNEARESAPLNPEVYQQMYHVLIRSGRGTEARIALLEGFILTGDSGLKQKVLGVYAAKDAKTCASSSGPMGRAIDSSCGNMRDDACATSIDAIRVLVKIGRRDLATSLQQEFSGKYGCPADPRY